MDGTDNDSLDPLEPLDLQIAAYVDGEMEDEQKAAFERRMAGDEPLRLHVDEWRRALAAARDWMQQDPPGVEKAAQLAPPRIEKRTSSARPSARVIRLSFRTVGLRATAAAVLLLVGFGFGRVTKSASGGGGPREAIGPRAAGPARTSVEIASTPAPTPAPARPQPEAPRAATPTPPRATVTPGNEEQMVASVAPAFRGVDQHGRVIIETPLRGSGGRATWVVDGAFRLPQSASKGAHE